MTSFGELKNGQVIKCKKTFKADLSSCHIIKAHEYKVLRVYNDERIFSCQLLGPGSTDPKLFLMKEIDNFE